MLKRFEMFRPKRPLVAVSKMGHKHVTVVDEAIPRCDKKVVSFDKVIKDTTT